MVTSRDLYILRRNYPMKLVGLVKNFIRKSKLKEDSVDTLIQVEEDDEHYEVWWLRAINKFDIISQTYLGRIKKNYVL